MSDKKVANILAKARSMDKTLARRIERFLDSILRIETNSFDPLSVHRSWWLLKKYVRENFFDKKRVKEGKIIYKILVGLNQVMHRLLEDLPKNSPKRRYIEEITDCIENFLEELE
ncbi:MAG: hypothetical protein ACTSX9_02900 [Candidatus Njordarchaeales archaeon]